MKTPDPRAVVQLLAQLYGMPVWRPRLDPMSELIACILSQNTSDANSIPAYDALVAKYPNWNMVMKASETEVAETIRRSGFANQKARRIQEALRRVLAERGDLRLEFLGDLPIHEARAWLMALPGIGPKCAAIVLCFSLNKPVIPVDTHVFRVGWRLGFYPEKLGAEKAHDALQALIPMDLAFPFHSLLIQHGRQICKAPKPRCSECPLTNLCAYYAAHRSGAG